MYNYDQYWTTFFALVDDEGFKYENVLNVTT